jgi:hypothetical protein
VSGCIRMNTNSPSCCLARSLEGARFDRSYGSVTIPGDCTFCERRQQGWDLEKQQILPTRSFAACYGLLKTVACRPVPGIIGRVASAVDAAPLTSS